MRRGILRLPMSEQVAVAAPDSGVQLGAGESGRPVSLRLFRLAGTRVVLAGPVLPAQLVAVRVAAAGTPVLVATSRPHLWEPLLPRDAGHVVSATEVRQQGGGPALVIDDRPPEARGPVEVRAWQCRLDMRTQWASAPSGASASALQSFAHADLTVFGAIPPGSAAAVARAFGVPAGAIEPLASLDAATVAVLRRGRLRFVSLNPTAAESRVLQSVAGR